MAEKTIPFGEHKDKSEISLTQEQREAGLLDGVTITVQRGEKKVSLSAEDFLRMVIKEPFFSMLVFAEMLQNLGPDGYVPDAHEAGEIMQAIFNHAVDEAEGVVCRMPNAE